MKSLSPPQIARMQKMFAAAQQARRSGQLKQAEQLCLDILKEAPDAHDVRNLLAVLMASQGRPNDAAKQFRNILKANPTHAQTHANLGNALMEASELQEAVTELKRAIALDARLVGAHIALGAILHKQGKSDAAIFHYHRALDGDKTNHVAFNGMGLAYRNMGDFARALESLEHAVGLAPDNAEYRFNFGETLGKCDLNSEAIEQFQKADQLKPNCLESMVWLGDLLEKTQRFDEALEYFERARTLKPGETDLLVRIGDIYFSMGDTEKAMACFEQSQAIHDERKMAGQDGS